MMKIAQLELILTHSDRNEAPSHVELFSTFFFLLFEWEQKKIYSLTIHIYIICTTLLYYLLNLYIYFKRELKRKLHSYIGNKIGSYEKYLLEMKF